MKKLLLVFTFIQLALVSAAQNIELSQRPAQEGSAKNPWDIYVIVGASFVLASLIILLFLLLPEWRKDIKKRRRKSAF